MSVTSCEAARGIELITATTQAALSSRMHHLLIRGLIETGSCPANDELARRLGMSARDVERALTDLAQIHGVVLHPHVSEPWLVHPFSTTPTMHLIKKEDRSWWAPCMWCALGVAALVTGAAQIHSRFGAETDSFVVSVFNGEPDKNEAWIHFAIPPVRAWQNVHQHCSMVLAFRAKKEIHEWCVRHRLPHGEDVRIEQVARLAKLWYGSHADPNWHKWTIAEAQEIFQSAGLVSDFWALGSRRGSF
jgi:hypothetical protein